MGGKGEELVSSLHQTNRALSILNRRLTLSAAVRRPVTSQTQGFRSGVRDSDKQYELAKVLE